MRTSRADRVSYVMDAPGDLIHMDTKKLGRIPDGGGHRVAGPQMGKKNRRGRKLGYAIIHNAIDDCSRLDYSEILVDERQETVVAFWGRAHAWFAAAGIEVKAVMTDNGNAYRSQMFAAALGTEIKHIRTRPYRPQTNGKVERFNRTMVEEWAYARRYNSETERVAAFADWLHYYNHHRGHTSLKGAAPADLITNLAGQHT